ncbi:putative NAD-binding protein [Lyophyllum shimeji]|uniref:NAD-binding protein n=1 Tax=Lyophyllum shimeji TaxID=47721 RepID=A0A9P3UJ53_LYOSH|nr:putative NAD-binding protein [Lyophyllum shimeji]
MQPLEQSEASLPVQSQPVSPRAPIGVNAAIQASRDATVIPRPRILDESSLKDRVGVVTGGHRGLGLEMALVLCELEARAVYCFDLPAEPSEEWESTQQYVRRMNNGSRLEYVSPDGRANGRLHRRCRDCETVGGEGCLECPATEFQEVLDVDTCGVFLTAQAAGRQMVRFGNPGSIILIASIAGNVAMKGEFLVAYKTSKSAVLQMSRSIACELADKGIRVNTVSPGFFRSPMTKATFDRSPDVLRRWSEGSPIGRFARPDELRGVIAWLASDASSFCTGSDIIVDGGYRVW